MSHLEKTWELLLIHDSYACRKGKGVHAAVSRLQQLMRQATANGTRQAYYLQLDIRNYFMRIDKQRLFEMVDTKLQPQRAEDREARWLAHRLVFHDCTRDPHFKGDPRLLERLPPHKTLFHAIRNSSIDVVILNTAVEI